eukprot:GHRQ01015713.1.p2 GENE.GHRQ01015713.1~~GHRQ01015713.1.p2  ORF type:complete len:127 (-),score=6.78 GHRQ01015713.1:1153-1533(-)
MKIWGHPEYNRCHSTTTTSSPTPGRIATYTGFGHDCAPGWCSTRYSTWLPPLKGMYGAGCPAAPSCRGGPMSGSYSLPTTSFRNCATLDCTPASVLKLSNTNNSKPVVSSTYSPLWKSTSPSSWKR